MNRMRQIFAKFLDVTGLDWLPVILSDRFYVSHDRQDQELTESFEVHHRELSLEQIKDVIFELSKLNSEEEKRQDKIESKALSLISFTGLSSAFVAGLVTVWGSAQYSVAFRQKMMLIYSLLLLSLFVTVVLAIKAIRVGKYAFMSPHIANFWKRESMSEVEYYQSQAGSLLRSYIHNRGIINDKASFVAGAQDWFRNTIMLLMVMTALIVFTPPESSSDRSSSMATQAPSSTATYAPTVAPNAPNTQSPFLPTATSIR